MSAAPHTPAIIAAHRDAAARLSSLPEPARAVCAAVARGFAERAAELEAGIPLANAAD